MKLHLPLALLALVASAAATDSSPAKDHKPEKDEKHKPEEKYCKITAHDSSSVHCQSKPGLMDNAVATVRDGASYEMGCYKEEGSCLFNHCEWYRVEWDGQSCYVNGYYTECDKEKHVEC